MSHRGSIGREHRTERPANENGFAWRARYADEAKGLLSERLNLAKLGSTRRTVLTWICQCEDGNTVGNVARKEVLLVRRDAPVLPREEDNAADVRSAITPNEHDIARPPDHTVRDLLARTARRGDVRKENPGNLET